MCHIFQLTLLLSQCTQFIKNCHESFLTFFSTVTINKSCKKIYSQLPKAKRKISELDNTYNGWTGDIIIIEYYRKSMQVFALTVGFIRPLSAR